MQKLLAEFIGSAFLLIGVVGSGIMAEALSGGNDGLALLANAIATGCMLYAIITTLGPVSGRISTPQSRWPLPCVVTFEGARRCAMWRCRSWVGSSVSG